MPAISGSFFGGLDHHTGELAAVQHYVVGPSDVALGVHGLRDREAEGHGQDRKDMVEAENNGNIKASSRGRMPGVTVASDPGGLFFRDDHCSVRLASRRQLRGVLHRGLGRSEPDGHRRSSRKLMSTAFAEWVIAPLETKSAPVSA